MMRSPLSVLMTAVVALAIGAAPVALQNPPPAGSTQAQGQQGQGGRQGGRGGGVAIQPGEECPAGHGHATRTLHRSRISAAEHR